ncbi:CLUMA_CG014117, isoform A [Clunio marinus]|uniref:CLUMA_CG014117, isoform A n=1 Tax=Clunio marinus TaxID=568069 RepID=A0A1J1IMA6_9DIPT|nr:CLUMA_CG014117, isoform A [Clunio marinus]
MECDTLESLDKSSEFAARMRKERWDKLKEHQEFNRMKAFDSNRFLATDILTEEDIKGLCSRIKRKKHAPRDDLIKLCNAFIQSLENISTFIKVTGAINVIIKEFTGCDRRQQLLAAQCLCNLSLGDEVCCTKIATFAGSYLMIYIVTSTDISLTKISIWISQNIAASGPKALSILMSQELLKNTLNVLNTCVELEIDALQLLDIIIDGTKHESVRELDSTQLDEIKLSLWSIMKKRYDVPIALQVFYKITMTTDAWIFNQEETTDLVIKMTTNLIEGVEPETNNKQIMHFSIKILMKSFKHNHQNKIKCVEHLMENNLKLSVLINSIIAANPKFYGLLSELMHFTSLLYVDQHPAIAKYFLYDSISDIKVPLMFEF